MAKSLLQKTKKFVSFKNKMAFNHCRWIEWFNYLPKRERKKVMPPEDLDYIPDEWLYPEFPLLTINHLSLIVNNGISPMSTDETCANLTNTK